MEVLKFLNLLFQRDKKPSKPNKIEGKSSDIEPSKELDYYLENGYTVFTESYHKKRGYCCGSGCRHCPYEKV